MPDEPAPPLCLVIPSEAQFYPGVPLDLLQAPPHAEFGEFIRDLVGGQFQVIRGPMDAWIYLNEDGKSLPLKENYVATAMGHEAGLSLADYVVGQVVVVGAPDSEGYDTSVPDAFLKHLEQCGCTIRRRDG